MIYFLCITPNDRNCVLSASGGGGFYAFALWSGGCRRCAVWSRGLRYLALFASRMTSRAFRETPRLSLTGGPSALKASVINKSLSGLLAFLHLPMLLNKKNEFKGVLTQITFWPCLLMQIPPLLLPGRGHLATHRGGPQHLRF